MSNREQGGVERVALGLLDNTLSRGGHMAAALGCGSDADPVALLLNRHKGAPQLPLLRRAAKDECSVFLGNEEPRRRKQNN